MCAHYRIYPVYVISEMWFGSAYVATRLYSVNMFTENDRGIVAFLEDITEFYIRELAGNFTSKPIIVRELRHRDSWAL